MTVEPSKQRHSSTYSTARAVRVDVDAMRIGCRHLKSARCSSDSPSFKSWAPMDASARCSATAAAESARSSTKETCGLGPSSLAGAFAVIACPAGLDMARPVSVPGALCTRRGLPCGRGSAAQTSGQRMLGSLFTPSGTHTRRFATTSTRSLALGQRDTRSTGSTTTLDICREISAGHPHRNKRSIAERLEFSPSVTSPRRSGNGRSRLVCRNTLSETVTGQAGRQN